MVKVYGYECDGKLPTELQELLEKDTITLFHGSRGGIKGKIAPLSRERCDFGSGFYMGENEIQPKGLIYGDAAPMLYSLSLNLKELENRNARVVYLTGDGWLKTVMSFREKVKQFNDLKMAEDIKNDLNSCDLIIGRIADDNMNSAIRRFENYGLTDEGLKACLERVAYGYQFVAKSQLACDCIKVLSEREVLENEFEFIENYNKEKRNQCKGLIDEMAVQYQRKGKYINELVSELKDEIYVGVDLL